jgi:cellulose synthase operon protein C
MASIVEKYEQILAADPRSRIFVELAKALLERGDAARAVEVCRQGLEHHPSSILGRVIWGRGLLEAPDVKGALDQFEIAVGLDPASPYAYNLVGEALLAKGHPREALPYLGRAAELQPADARVKGWLDEARRRLREGGEDAGPGEPAEAPLPQASEITATFVLPPREHATAAPVAPRVAAGSAPAVTPVGVPVVNPARNGVARPSAGSGRAGEPSSSGRAGEQSTSSRPGELSAAARAGETSAPGEPVEPRTASTAEAEPQVPLPAPSAEPPRPPPLRAPSSDLHRDEIPRSLLSMIPGATRATLAALPDPEPHAPAVPDAAEADRIAARYEAEVRERLLATGEPPPSLLRRHRKLVAGGAAALALLAAGGVFLAVRAHRAAEAAAGAATRARAGLARDTKASLAEAFALLGQARRASPDDPELRSVQAQVAAVLADEHGDADARAVAEAAAADDAASDGALTARWLLATTPAARDAAAHAILDAPPSVESPLVQALAGRILAARGERAGARGRLEIAARADGASREPSRWPPLLRALSDLGDLAVADGDPDGALPLYQAVLDVQATHPRAVVGAAEARLALGRELDVAKAQLAAVDADAGSAPPLDLRPRFEIATARVLAATGDGRAAADRLARASGALGEKAPLLVATAEVQLSLRAWDRAEAAAQRAVALAPSDEAARVLLARARIGRGRYAEALAATERAGGRPARIQRAIARYRLGQYAQARAELEATTRDGRMPAEAVVWYGLTELAQGRADRARAVLDKLAQARTPPPLTFVAVGRVAEAQARPDDAERAYRTAIEREPSAPEGPLALGALLLGRGKAADAVAVLEQAVALDPADPEARRALGGARLAAGQPAAARADLDAVLMARPADPEALRLVSAAWLAEGSPDEARRAAERGLAAAPRNPGLLLAGARAALAAGVRPEAKALAERALRSGAAGDGAADARRILAEAGAAKRKR